MKFSKQLVSIISNLNIKLEFIYPDRLINLFVRMDANLLIIGMSSCTGARVGISSFGSQNACLIEKEGEHKFVVLIQKVTGHDPVYILYLSRSLSLCISKYTSVHAAVYYIWYTYPLGFYSETLYMFYTH